MKFLTVDAYLETLDLKVKEKLIKLRAFILTLDERITESIGYNMPEYRVGVPVIYFFAYKKHIGIYPHPDAIEAFKASLTGYKTSKGAIQIPIDDEIPFDLIRKIVRYNIQKTQA